MKKSKFLAAALAATMFATAACGLVACDKDAGVLPGGDGGTQNPPISQGTEYTITFTGVSGTKTTSGGKLSGTMPTPTTIPDGKKFDGWAFSATAESAVITTETYTTYKFSGTTTTITLYPVYGDANSDGPNNDGPNNDGPNNDGPNNDGPNNDGPNNDGPNNDEPTGDNYCEVGGTKYNLTETTLAGADMAYSVEVEMGEGDTISFYIEGELIEAWPGYTWNGLKKSVKASEFTAARAGTFEFELGYYPENEETGDEATWSVNGDDGQAPMLPDTAVMLKFSDATITIAFDLPGWATTAAYIYVFSNGAPAGDAWPGTEMNGSEISIGKNLGDCQIIISFQQDGAQKKSEDTDTTAFSDGGTYKAAIGEWTGDGVFNLSIEEA